MDLEITKKILRYILPTPSAFKGVDWLISSFLYVLIGAFLGFFLPNALLVTSLLSLVIMLIGVFSNFRHAQQERTYIARQLRTYSNEASKLWQLSTKKYDHPPHIRTNGGSNRTTRKDKEKPALRKRLKAWFEENFQYILPAIVTIAIAIVLIYGAPLLWQLISNFFVHLVSEKSRLATFMILLLSICVGFIVLFMTFTYLPEDVVKEIGEKKVEIGVLGMVILTATNILILIQGMQGLSAHYTTLTSIVSVGMIISLICIASSWILCCLLLTRGIEKRNISNLLLAITIGAYAMLTMLYVTSEALGFLLGLN